MSMNKPLNRRTMLKGLGVTLALPWLESANVFGSSALAQGAAGEAVGTGVAASGAPLRMAAIRPSIMSDGATISAPATA